MKCPECNNEINLKLKHCSNCGYPISNLKEEHKVEKKVSENLKLKESNKKEKDLNNFNKIFYKEELVKSIGFTLLLILFLNFFKIVVTQKSGNISIFEMMKWILTKYIGVTYSISNIFIVIIIAFLLLGMILSSTRRKIHSIIAIVGYILFTIFLILFGIALRIINRNYTMLFYLLIIIILIWIIYLFIRKDKVVKVRKENIVDEIKEAKELLDNGIITEEEFRTLKSKILNKE